MFDNLVSTIKPNDIPFKLPSNWKWYKWGDLICKYEQGLIRSNNQLNNTGVAYLKMNNLDNDGGYSLSKLEHTDATSEEIKRYKLKRGDFLINVRNSKELVGKTCTIGNLDFDLIYNHMLVRIEHHKGVSGFYINSLLKTPVMRKFVERCKKGTTTVIALYQKDLYEIPIPLPDEVTHDRIVKFIENYLDKIELNNKINAELEAMAKITYDYWFVQFDFPNAKGKPYKSSGGKMVWNEELKREVPEGWEVKDLYTIANYINGLACQKYRPRNDSDEFLPVIKIREMNDGISSNTEKARIDIPEKYIIDDGDVLFSWSATLDVKIWTEGKGALNQHIFKIESDKYPRTFFYFELINYLHHFKMMAELRKTTMGHITIDHLKTSLISVPPIELVNELNKKINPILEKTILNKKENQQLASLRDWLLPMLMNGQVKVGDAEKMVEEKLSMAAEPRGIYKKSKVK